MNSTSVRKGTRPRWSNPFYPLLLKLGDAVQQLAHCVSVLREDRERGEMGMLIMHQRVSALERGENEEGRALRGEMVSKIQELEELLASWAPLMMHITPARRDELVRQYIEEEGSTGRDVTVRKV